MQSSRTMARIGLRMMPTFPSSPLKFRTAGFPRYGFKPAVDGHLRPAGLIGHPQSVQRSLVSSPFRGNRRIAASKRSPSGHTGPEALGAASGYAVPLRHRLLWPHPSFWIPPAGLSASSDGSLLSSRDPQGPRFKLRVCRSVPPPLPRWIGWWLTVRSPPVLAFAHWEQARRPRLSTRIGTCGGTFEATEFA